MSILGTAMNVGMTAFSYTDYKKKGDSTTMSIVKAGGQAAFMGFFPELAGLMMAKDAIVGGLQVATQIGKMNTMESAKAYSPHLGGHYQDTKVAATMRQRGLNAIQNNGLNARNVMGSEARSYFRNGY